jgi:hypothetical protein
MDRIHGDFDAELLELDLQQATSQGFRRILSFFSAGSRIEIGGSTFHGAVDEQRHLLLFLHALAWLRRLDRRRGDDRRHLLLALRHVLAQACSRSIRRSLTLACSRCR